MAKIEIKNSPEEMERICAFLIANNIPFEVVQDYGNHSLKQQQAYDKILNQFQKK